MGYKIEYSDFVESDLIEISDYLSGFYEKTLERFLYAYDKRILALADNPYLYRVCLQNSAYRRAIISDYVVIYKVIEESKTVEVYRVLHSSRNIELILK